MPKTSHSVPRALVIAFALVGVAIMAYLAKLHFIPSADAFCNIGEGVSCDIVNTSAYAKLLGIPVSILGLLYFLGVLAMVFGKRGASAMKGVALLSIVMLGPSLYLTAIEVFVLKNICVLCEASKLLMVGIIAASWAAWRPKANERKMVAAAVLAAGLLAAATFAVQARSTPMDVGTYDEFAECLYGRGMRMYGSVTCSFCARQRALFGDSFRFINEIECDPRNPGSEAVRCIAKNITHTPTWIRENTDGSDAYRFDAGVQSLETLSKISGCPLPELE